MGDGQVTSDVAGLLWADTEACKQELESPLAHERAKAGVRSHGCDACARAMAASKDASESHRCSLCPGWLEREVVVH